MLLGLQSQFALISCQIISNILSASKYL